MQTLDGHQFTFNGQGEFWMVKSETFELQARLVRAWNALNEPSVTGTVFGAAAGRAWYTEANTTASSSRVHVAMSADRTSTRLATDSGNVHSRRSDELK